MKQHRTYKLSSILLVLFILISSLLFAGCIDDEETEKNLLVYYSSTSKENVTFQIEIWVDDENIMNDTVKPEPGGIIYKESSNNENYNIVVKWGNKTAETDFKPNGQNSLEIEIYNENLYLQEVTD